MAVKYIFSCVFVAPLEVYMYPMSQSVSQWCACRLLIQVFELTNRERQVETKIKR